MSSSQTNVQTRSLWIGEVEYWMDEGFINKIFQEKDSANIKSIKIIRDKTKTTNLSYGFIEFESQEVAKEILEEFNGKFISDTNKTLKLNWAAYSAGKQAAMNYSSALDYSIYVGDLDLNVSEEKLKEFFSKFYPSVIGSKIIIDPINKSSKGYGFVKFSDQTEASKALTEMNGQYFYGKQIKTNQASFKRMNSDSNILTGFNNNNQLNTFSQPNYLSEPNPFNMSQNMFSFNMNIYSPNPEFNIANNHNSLVPTPQINLANLNNFYMQNDDINQQNPNTFNLSNFYQNNLHNNPYYCSAPRKNKFS